ncbi:MAG: hypothetical protein A2268_13745 [Candidatus Raymondbacteria bacterium RifOxyA12_full_50_37]|uniref:SPOR domain-containing protein n=1 Tax=Candidatus Raymondbacteria bacterium RIFOXYD12_FULL_49_13 TaxID=1817890 RepID=A0A1F7FLV7_UNCRA|nr:MAG: hypothetical protein A2248_08100 [Candidatus Raymondbacteria bacterium RIFOXYA2_FULL_49_16]OGJ87201.1 MAG: hypothetical protein A2350_04350 [Candidatus Raymondbacteria bacterium RifOxyB12_full_50_8]OGJ91672.1 MAG: hypothetical protein A2268_13745 [Candidatus Raymondbacteria bacterium RifOxyA12_full_50_37]OGJ95217.1 MAG: hypothetical protein A2453_12110 [Candidatus Raymondbacteria bacterium RIFOXYC2_FULL_50_21]OGK05995.1 MAG: hypothetical protein A2487_14425 [Candidatus Raymondbacteria b
MKTFFILIIGAFVSFLQTSCSPARPAATQAPVPTSAQNKNPAPQAGSVPRPATQPAQKKDEPVAVVKREKGDFHLTAVDSASMGNEILLSTAKIKSENVIEGADQKSNGQELTDKEKTEFKIVNGFRIQVYATTDFKEAERKKEDLQLGIEDRVYVVYEAPFYKIRVGNFETEAKVKDLKKTLGEMGYETWIVPSKIRTSGK